MALNVGILLDDEICQPADISVEGIHAHPIEQATDLIVGQVYNIISESATKEFELVFFGCRSGVIGFTTLYYTKLT